MTNEKNTEAELRHQLNVLNRRHNDLMEVHVELKIQYEELEKEYEAVKKKIRNYISMLKTSDKKDTLPLVIHRFQRMLENDE